MVSHWIIFFCLARKGPSKLFYFLSSIYLSVYSITTTQLQKYLVESFQRCVLRVLRYLYLLLIGNDIEMDSKRLPKIFLHLNQ